MSEKFTQGILICNSFTYEKLRKKYGISSQREKGGGGWVEVEGHDVTPFSNTE